MQIVTVGYGPRILRYRSKDFETSEQFSATFAWSRVVVLRRTCSGHLALNGALHSPGEAENIFVAETPDPRTQMYRRQRFVLWGARQIYFSSRVLRKQDSRRSLSDIVCIFRPTSTFHIFRKFRFLCVRIAVSQGCACCLWVSHGRSHETSLDSGKIKE